MSAPEIREASPAPEQGQIVALRHKIWAVTNVRQTKSGSEVVNNVGLECLSDDSIGREIHVIWEREISPTVLESTSLPPLKGVDHPATFMAFLNALRWSSASLAEGNILQAPFRGGVQIEEYQLAPVVRATQMPRVRLLIADDVGLGKTIEAGLIAQELIHSHRANRVLVVCPAHLKTKWIDELAEKFGLEFRIIERETVINMRREFGPTINPWASFPRLVTSLDYLKQEHPQRLFEELAHRQSEDRRGVKPWDLLILDEAHNVSPSGGRSYIRDSDRTRMMRMISEHFEHKVFLTATPHNGYRESFTGLLELLDNLRFSRGTELDRKQLGAVTVRRLKDHILNLDGSRRFPERLVLPRDEEHDPGLYVQLKEKEIELFDLLNTYTESRLSRVEKGNRKRRPTEFVLTLLKKRALSSPMALRESLVTHTDTVGLREELDVGDSLFRSLEEKEQDDWSDDEEKEEAIEAATAAASRLCDTLTLSEQSQLRRMFEIADEFANGNSVLADSKAIALVNWIRHNLQSDGKWNDERVIIFTEYVHTLRYLERVFEAAGMDDAVLTVFGGMPFRDSGPPQNKLGRKSINEVFQSNPSTHPVRILLATDAASEGADFQRHCRNLIHYDIPWNPIRLEQRNGRIDRHGQTASRVLVHHFVYSNQADSRFLEQIVKKVEAIRTDLGCVSRLVADSVRKRVLGEDVTVDDIEKDARRELAVREMVIEDQDTDKIGYLVMKLNESRDKLGISNDSQLQLLEEALLIEGCQDAVSKRNDGTFVITSVPRSWGECRGYLTTEHFDRPLTFDRAKGRSDESIMIVHLDHPLMRRAMSAFRVQMWSSDDGRLKRVTVHKCDGLSKPVVVAWGRLALLGPEHNRLHEGLVSCAYVVGDKLLEEYHGELIPSESDGVVDDLDNIREMVEKHLLTLTDHLNTQGAKLATELTDVLKSRGIAAEKQARELASERITAIRKTIKEWEKHFFDPQGRFQFDDDEEDDQRKVDLECLRARLEELIVQREIEPRRQRDLYRVTNQRVYPLALQILLPREGS